MNNLTPIDRHVRRDGGDYRDAFLTLLPTGQAWPKHAIDSILWKVAYGLNDYWGTVDSRAADLLERESDPRQTIELLPDWERNWGLPDPCYEAPQTIDQRHIALLMRMTLLGGQSREFFIKVAHDYLGYDISITEYRPFMVGLDRCGDNRELISGHEQSLLPTLGLDTNSVVDGVYGDYPYILGKPENRFFWTVHVHLANLQWFRASSGQCGVDPHLRIGLADDLECLLGRWKPAHTEIVFDYSNLKSGESMAGTP